MSISKKEVREVAQTAKSATSFMRRALRAASFGEGNHIRNMVVFAYTITRERIEAYQVNAIFY